MKLSWSRRLKTTAIPVLLVCVLPNGAGAQTRPNQWSLSIGFQEVGRKDSGFVTDGFDDEFLIADSLGVALSFARQTPRGHFSLFSRGSAVVFRDFREFDDFNYSGAVSGSRQLSLHTTFSFREAFSSGFDLARLSSLGFSNPRLDAKTVVGDVGLAHRVSPRTTTFVRFGHDWLSFVSLQSIDASQFVLDPTPPGNDETGLPPEGAEVDPGGQTPNGGPLPDERFPVTPDGQDFVLDVLSSEGLELPQQSALSGSLTAGISTQLSPRATAFGSVHYGWREFFDSPRQASGPYYGGTAGISRLFGRSDRLFANYHYGRNEASNPSTATQTLSGGWSRLLGDQLSVFLSGGASYFQTTPQTDPGDTSLFVATGISHSTESTSFSARYERSVRQALGFGRSFLTDDAAVTLSQAIGRRLRAMASAGYTLGEDLLDPESRPSAFRYGGEISYRVVNAISVGGRYLVSENTFLRAGEELSLERSLWSFFVSYGHSWQ